MYSTDELLPSQFQEADDLLRSCDLSVPMEMDLRVGVFRGVDLIATGALCGRIIQGVAVDHEHRGEGLAASVVMNLISRAVGRGLGHLLLFTKYSERETFSGLGMKEIASVPGGAALFEWGTPGMGDFLSQLRKAVPLKTGVVGCVVMNANPFTLGHLHLVEIAASECDQVIVIVVREERSAFPFAVRMDLVRSGLAHMTNVLVVDGGDYVVSSATFPSYFTGEESRSRVHAELDLEVFCRHIAPTLGIKRRYVGTEPLCPVTSAYNLAMKERLPENGIDVREVPRLEYSQGVVSASMVRSLIGKGDIEGAALLVPEATSEFLRSSEMETIIRNNNLRKRH